MPPGAQGPGNLEGPAELLVHGPEGMTRARVHAQLQRLGRHNHMED